MPDLAMCQHDECPAAKRCYRHEATPSQYPMTQFYAEFAPDESGKCEAFVQMPAGG
jgi:hypothetical protein